MGVTAGTIGAVATAAGGIASAAMSGGGGGGSSDAQIQAAMAANKTQRDMYNTSRGDYAPYIYYGGKAEEELAKLMGLYSGGVPELLYPTDLKGQALLLRKAAIDSLKNNNDTYQNGTTLDAEGWPVATTTTPQNMLAAAVPYSRGQINRMSDAEIWSTFGPRSAKVDPKIAQQEAFSRFTASPDYQFRLQEGEKGIMRNAAASGGAQSGATQKALMRYGQGLASNEYGNYWNRLSSLAGSGQTAVNNISAIGQNTANQIAGNQLAMGQARASGYINQQNAQTANTQNWLNLGGSILGGMGGGGGGYLGNLLTALTL